MRNTCPSCQIEYAVTPQDVGRRILCKGCGAALVVAEDGLRLDPQSAVPVAVPAGFRLGDLWGVRIHADVPTLVFGAGMFFVIVFLFMPLVGRAKVERRRAELNEETMEQSAEIKRLRAKQASEQQIKATEERWERRQEDLQQSVKAAEYGSAASSYYDLYGLMLGFLLAAFGSLGFLRADQPYVRRVVGAVVVTALLVLVLVSLLFFHGRDTAGPG